LTINSEVLRAVLVNTCEYIWCYYGLTFHSQKVSVSFAEVGFWFCFCTNAFNFLVQLRLWTDHHWLQNWW